MKRKWIIAAALLAVGGACYIGSHHLMADPGGAARAGAPQTRIALVNLSHVIKGYKKYLNFQTEIKGEVEKFQKRDQEIRAHMKQCDDAIKNPMTPETNREQYRHYMQTDQHQLEDNQAEAKASLGKKSDEQMVILYKEVREMTTQYAKSQGIELVMHYNDALETDQVAFWSPANVARKMQAGACMPVYVTPGMDISEAILQMLNSGQTTR